MTARQRLRSALLAALTAALVITPAVFAPPAAAAAVVVLDGRGYGHGIGMSQHGAQGRAQAGQNYTSILAAYYPGTSVAAGSDSDWLRVLAQGDTDSVMTVRAETRMTLRTARGTGALPTTVAGATPTQWRLRTTNGVLVLEALAGGAWRPHGTSELTALLTGAKYADLMTGDGSIQLQLGSIFREYVGALRAVRGAPQRTVIVTTFANYLPSVVTSEMPSSWHAQALAAQAVAARSYARWERSEVASASYWDTCDSTSCQVFSGIAEYSSGGTLLRSFTAASTRAAVTGTAGRYLSYGGLPAFTQFSASNGGYSVAGSRPYLAANRDPYDGLAPWRVELTSGQIESAYPAIGFFRTLSITRDGRGDFGGRAITITIIGTGGSVTVTGAAFRTKFGLRSTLFAAKVNGLTPVARDVTRDNVPDIIGTHPSGKLVVWPGNGQGAFGIGLRMGNGWGSMAEIALSQSLTGSGHPEVLAVERNTGLLWAYPYGPNGWLSRVLIGGSAWRGMDVVMGVDSFRTTGAPGILARQRTTGRLYYYESNGNGGFLPSMVAGTGWSAFRHVTSAGDWNRDGFSDLLAVDASGRLWLYPGNGIGSFGTRSQLGHGWGSMQGIVGGADWNGDGYLDVVAQDSSGTMWLYLGTSRGTISGRTLVSSTLYHYSLIG
jgi:stage II sporulation protein D